ncbi:cupin domain-containing protein (plasmid) [Pseudomonas sp. App30]|uniref:cupin domain-containing protein n=1 Tax=Pseudomonas sp. App30 TaxID=3068990 RepID=UPI003A807903
MSIRRVVTGTVDGRSVIVSDGPVPRRHDYRHVPGFSSALVWATSPGGSATVSVDPVSPQTSYVPGAGGTTLAIVTFPPDTVFASDAFDPSAAFAEQQAHLTGLVDHFDPERPGMHATPTVDYGIVLDGTISLELDDGAMVELAQHSVVIQRGTVHAWRNTGSKPATLAFVLISAE